MPASPSVTHQSLRDTSTTVVTINGLMAQTRLINNVDPKTIAVEEHTTIGESISARHHVTAGHGDFRSPLIAKLPTIGYFQLGISGRGMYKTGAIANGHQIEELRPHEFSPKFQGLFGPVPFAVRSKGNDLTPAEQASYGLRLLCTCPSDNVEYITYWLMQIDSPKGVRPVEVDPNVTTGTPVIQRFSPVAADLIPDPTHAHPSKTQNVFGKYIATEAILGITMSSTQVALAKEAKRIWTGSAVYDVTEIGMVTAETTNAANHSGVREVRCAQLAAWLPMLFNLNGYEANGFSMEIMDGIDAPEAVLPTP